MNDKQIQCDPRRIQQCLGDSLSDNERAEFEAHLESCADCRRALESSAADIGDWQAAREFLSSADSPPLPKGDSSDAATGDIELAPIDDVLADEEPQQIGWARPARHEARKSPRRPSPSVSTIRPRAPRSY